MPTPMHMPKTTMNHNYCVEPGQNNIRRSGQFSIMQPEPIAQPMQQFSNYQLWCCITSFYGYHIAMALLSSEPINQFRGPRFGRCLT